MSENQGREAHNKGCDCPACCSPFVSRRQEAPERSCTCASHLRICDCGTHHGDIDVLKGGRAC